MEEGTGRWKGEMLANGEKGWLSNGFVGGTRRRVRGIREMKKANKKKTNFEIS